MKFSLDNVEMDNLNSWLKSKDLSTYTGAIGGRFTYSFTPTNIGLIIKVKDNVDNTEIDVTDYDGF